jgi:regulator of sirC expression with transglutaminase-like and TPR domain
MGAPHDEKQARALEEILAGDDADMVDLTVRELRSQKDSYRPLIEKLAGSPDAKVRSRARLLLRFWAETTQAVPSPLLAGLQLRTWEDLEKFCWDLAKIENPEAELEEGKSYLDELGQLVEKNLPHRSISPTDSISALRQILARREGFRGNLDNYFDPSNSYLHRVLQTKMGIPLTLALVYLFAGQRAGLDVYGMNTPGHYLAGMGGVIFDPFHGAVVMSADDLSAKFGTDRTSWANPMYMRATPRDTAERMLVNLLNSYSRLGDEARHSRTVSCLQMIEENLG